MLIKFLKHGQGSPAKAASYVIDQVDHLNRPRAGVDVLAGDPIIFNSLCESSPHQWKYTSGVIAWSKEDQPMDHQIREVLNEFEQHAFAGLESHQYHLFVTQHIEDDGSKHLHILVPRIELETGRSLNIAPPGHQKYYDLLRDYFNAKYNWSDPADPLLTATTQQPDHINKLNAQAKKILGQNSLEQLKKNQFCTVIDNYVKTLLKSQVVKNRTDIAKSLRELEPIEAVKEGKDYLTVVLNNGKKHRLKGDYYNDRFEINAYTKHLKAADTARKLRAENKEHPAPPRTLLDTARRKRQHYYRDYYRPRTNIRDHSGTEPRTRSPQPATQTSQYRPDQASQQQFEPTDTAITGRDSTIHLPRHEPLEPKYVDSHRANQHKTEQLKPIQDQTDPTDRRSRTPIHGDTSDSTSITTAQNADREQSTRRSPSQNTQPKNNLDCSHIFNFFGFDRTHQYMAPFQRQNKHQTDRNAKERYQPLRRHIAVTRNTDAEPSHLLRTDQTQEEINPHDHHERNRQIHLESTRIIEDRKRIAERTQRCIDQTNRITRENQLRTDAITRDAERYQENAELRKSATLRTPQQLRTYAHDLKEHFLEQFRTRIAPVFTAIQTIFSRPDQKRHDSVHHLGTDQSTDSRLDFPRDHSTNPSGFGGVTTAEELNQQLSQRLQDLDTTTLVKAIEKIDHQKQQQLEQSSRAIKKSEGPRFER